MSVPIFLFLLLTSGWICHGSAKQVGGAEKQDPNDPVYQMMAKELVYSHLRIQRDDIKNITVYEVTRQAVNGFVVRINLRVFLVNGDSNGCKFKLWDQSWKNVKHVTFVCDEPFSVKTLSSRNRHKSQTEQARNPSDPKYKKLARASLEHWFTTNDPKPFKEKDIQDIRVIYVYTLLSSVIVYHINFLVTTDDSNKFKCVSSIKETPWNPTATLNYVQTKCKESTGDDLPDMPGGETEQDPNDPKYKQLAAVSFMEYKKKNFGLMVKVKDYKVTKVTTQVVSGIMTRLDFIVIPLGHGKSFSCHSAIVENIKKEITVNCQLDKKLPKSHSISGVAGGETDQNPYDPKYKKMAEESFREYRLKHLGLMVKVKDYRVTRVTTQVVAGYITRLDFNVIPVDGKTFQCHSEIRDIVETQREIIVKCQLDKKLSKTHSVNGVAGGETVQNPYDPKYKKMAEESFSEYRIKHLGVLVEVKDYRVTRVTTQVVAGKITRLDFNVIPVDGKTFKCHSEIRDLVKIQREIIVNCQLNKKLSKSHSVSGVAGGETVQNPDDPKYKKMAEESFREYRLKHLGLMVKVKDYRVTRVTEQVVAGHITRLDFNVIPVDGKTFQCHSEIRDLVETQRKIIVDCQLDKKLSKSHSVSGQLGGETVQNPYDPKYKKMAEESFREYRIKHLGLMVKVKDYRVTRVTEQVVAGTITRLDFNVIPVDGKTFQCHSEIRDIFETQREIIVNCQLDKNLSKSHSVSGVAGGETVQDPDDPKYKKMAEESFREYRIKHLGLMVKVKDYRVTRVTEQVVAGYITRLNFNVIPVDGKTFQCHSEIRDIFDTQREIIVNCQLDKKLSKSHSVSGVAGGETVQDPDDPKYKKMAEESFREYRLKHLGLMVKVKDYRVTRVTEQVVAGTITRLDFNVIPVDGKSFPCHSEILEQPWLNSTYTNVNCYIDESATGGE